MSTHRLIAHFGSLRTTLVLMALLAGVVLAGTAQPLAGGLVLGGAFAALGLNLLAALVVHPAFRRQLPLLVAHLAGLALLLLVGYGRLASLDGRFELTEGVPFDGQLLDGASGPLYAGGLQRLSFRHEGFQIDYAPGRKRGATRNRVTWQDADGQVLSATIGDHRPLVIDGHRIYTSPNKGFAPQLTWRPERGEPQRGVVHLPSYPMHELAQSREWTLPDGRAVWVQLQFDETLIDPATASSFRLPQQHRLVLRMGQARHELAPGQGVRVDGGVLQYDGLRTWMGYRVTHDPTLPWLLAAALVAAFALLLHYLLKFRQAGPVRVPPPAHVPMPTPPQARQAAWPHEARHG